MYSSGYSKDSKYSLEAQKKMQYRSKGKSCGYYVRIVFFFSSLIQSLIIVSLVLFLIYGKNQDSASTSRIQDLEESFSRLSIENVALRQQRKNLTNLLNVTLINKARNDFDLANLLYLSNISAILIQDMDRRLLQCTSELMRTTRITVPCQTPRGCNCGLLPDQLKARLELVESNFTQTTHRMKMQIDQISKDRDNINLEAIHLRREKSIHEKEVEFYRQKCKDDFATSLSGVSNVTKAFLQKVDSLFPAHIAFQLTCAKQREHLEQIRTNCSSLSNEVEDKFQRYLNTVGEQVSGIQGENSRLKAENWRLSEDYRWCSQNRTGMIQQHRQNVNKLQQKHDEDKERLLMDKMRLNGEIEVLVNNVKYKTKEAEHLTEQIKQLNMSCVPRTEFGGFQGAGTQSQPGWRSLGGGGSSSSTLFSTGSGFNKPASTGSGSSSSSLLSTGSGSSTGSGFNKPGSTGSGSSSSSLLSTGSGSSTGSGFNKPASTGSGSSSSSLLSTGSGSSTGSGFNKPGSTGSGSSSSSLLSTGSGSSTGSGFNKPGSTGSGSSSSTLLSAGSGSSTGTGLSSSGIASNKPALSGRGSPASGPFSGSPGSSSKSGSSTATFPWFGLGSLGQSKTGSETGKGTSSGNNNGGTGPSFGAGRTSGQGGGHAVSVEQHLKALQRIINPPVPEDKQALSRILG